MKPITILGSTGSIGTQTLDIVATHPDKFRVVGLAAGNNIELLSEQISQFQPEIVAIGDREKIAELQQAIGYASERRRSRAVKASAIGDLPQQPIILAGEEGVAEVARYGDARSVVTGIVGCAGLLPTIAAIEAGKDIALANKETFLLSIWIIS